MGTSLEWCGFVIAPATIFCQNQYLVIQMKPAAHWYKWKLKETAFNEIDDCLLLIALFPGFWSQILQLRKFCIHVNEQ